MVGMSIIPFTEGSRVATMTARATSVTSSGCRAAAPRGRVTGRLELSFERMEIIFVMDWRWGLSVVEDINPGRMNIDLKPSI